MYFVFVLMMEATRVQVDLTFIIRPKTVEMVLIVWSKNIKMSKVLNIVLKLHDDNK